MQSSGDRLGAYQWIVLGIIALLWSGAGSAAALHFTAPYPEHRAGAIQTVLTTAFFITLGHLLILLMFRSSSACTGMLIGKGCMLPLTLLLGLGGTGLGLFTTLFERGTMARDAGMVLPQIMLVAAFFSLFAGFIGALIGHAARKRRGRWTQQTEAGPPPPWQQQ